MFEDLFCLWHEPFATLPYFSFRCSVVRCAEMHTARWDLGTISATFLETS
jgi:hypothetical protein